MFGDITWRIADGVFEFYRPGTPGQPAGGAAEHWRALPAGEILTATFELGNSSPVRKRVTVLLHDADFSDLAACTFWLPPQPLQTYVIPSDHRASRVAQSRRWLRQRVSCSGGGCGRRMWTRVSRSASTG